MKILDRWPIFLYCLNTIYFSNIDYWATQKAILDLTDRFNKEILGLVLRTRPNISLLNLSDQSNIALS